jgi:hypothetical protein
MPGGILIRGLVEFFKEPRPWPTVFAKFAILWATGGDFNYYRLGERIG